MTTETTSLAAWLLEQIEADEAVARAANGSSRRVFSWEDLGHGDVGNVVGDQVHVVGNNVRPWNVAHIARHDPARVLAQCKAHRAIVELHPPEVFADNPELSYCKTCDEGIGGFWPCPTIAALVSIYADRPGFDARWAV